LFKVILQLTAMKNIYLELLETTDTGHNIVLATVTGTIGSTPQKPGSSAIFKNDKLISGTVGGGVVEGKVQEAAKNCSVSHRSKLIHLMLNSDISEKDEAICGGEIDILVDADPGIHLPVFREMQKSAENREPGVLITMITKHTEDHVHINRYWMTGNNIPRVPVGLLGKVEPVARRIITSADHNSFVQMELPQPGENPSSLLFIEPVFPKPLLVIAGAGHIGKALSHLAGLLDFEVTVIDDRPDFANSANLPDADHIIVKDIGEAMTETVKSSDTFIVIVTRGHKDDAHALKPCIGSGAAYVGMIGSRGKVARMKADFIEKVWASEEQWKCIHTPVGLDINSETVEEIAISIAAELIQVRNGRNES
jgi:xanthine dehydrogenase accessory factor